MNIYTNYLLSVLDYIPMSYLREHYEVVDSQIRLNNYVLEPHTSLYSMDGSIIEYSDESSNFRLEAISDPFISLTRIMNDLGTIKSTGGVIYMKSKRYNGKNKVNCSICMDNLEQKEYVYELKCKHVFHKTCLSPWIKVKPHCPNCRQLVKIKNTYFNF